METRQPRKEHGDKLRRLRQAAGLTQMALAAELGATKQAVSAWENGLNQPNRRNRQAMAGLYGIPLRELSRASDWVDDGNSQRYSRANLDPGKLREARQKLNLTQTQAAKRAGLSLSAISQYETGKVTPKVNAILRLAAAYGQPVDNLMTPPNREGKEKNVGRRDSGDAAKRQGHG